MPTESEIHFKSSAGDELVWSVDWMAIRYSIVNLYFFIECLQHRTFGVKGQFYDKGDKREYQYLK